MSKSILTRQQKLFRMESVCPFDANNVSLDEAMAKLFIYLRTGGRKIPTTSKPFCLAEGQAVPGCQGGVRHESGGMSSSFFVASILT
jgi:hypothetical protein